MWVTIQTKNLEEFTYCTYITTYVTIPTTTELTLQIKTKRTVRITTTNFFLNKKKKSLKNNSGNSTNKNEENSANNNNNKKIT